MFIVSDKWCYQFVIITNRDNRLYVLRVQGLLILNSVQNDEGVYRCSYFARGSFGAKEYDLRIVASDEPDENSEVSKLSTYSS